MRAIGRLIAMMFAPILLMTWSAAQAQPGHGRGPGHDRGQPHHGGPQHGGPGHGGPGQWRGDIGRFHEHDWGTWRGGYWAHGHHGGRAGWWWIVGPAWYYYPQPVYPYPSPWEPDELIITGPGVVMPPPAPYWHYCPSSRNYYPYVPVCPGGWQLVPAVPDPRAPAPIPQVP